MGDHPPHFWGSQSSHTWYRTAPLTNLNSTEFSSLVSLIHIRDGAVPRPRGSMYSPAFCFQVLGMAWRRRHFLCRVFLQHRHRQARLQTQTQPPRRTTPVRSASWWGETFCTCHSTQGHILAGSHTPVRPVADDPGSAQTYSRSTVKTSHLSRTWTRLQL